MHSKLASYSSNKFSSDEQKLLSFRRHKGLLTSKYEIKVQECEVLDKFSWSDALGVTN